MWLQLRQASIFGSCKNIGVVQGHIKPGTHCCGRHIIGLQYDATATMSATHAQSSRLLRSHRQRCRIALVAGLYRQG